MGRLTIFKKRLVQNIGGGLGLGSALGHRCDISGAVGLVTVLWLGYC